MLNVDQIVATQKSQAATFYELANQAVAGVEKLAELNLKALKASVTDGAAQTEALLNVKDVQGLLALQGDLKAASEKASAYGRELYEIATGLNSGLTKVAEARTAEVQKQFTALVDSAVKNAPAIPGIQNAVSTASSALESVQKAFKQASEQAAANFNNLTSSALNAAETVKVKKAA